ncbi:hypothetical protein [Sulfurospirillum barnesii]|uniref:Uncharacterized protein n=1 Tax=Sulfurospirillum barnesii (strain ATCC 700032 / DSM 10660 / SES-3) TaxID=760154 RepID=I3XXC4_SULBS|nr:hypothetical protein [Sulfurospirillum barnesii]AFL68598.1 hypothetical protein Sulba_1306 [Sulfurospirillum barnesii SES-3]
MKKECAIFIILLFVLSLGIHMNQWIAYPIEHFKHLAEHQMPYHPLLYTFIVYLLLGIIRLVIHGIIKLFTLRSR